MSKRLLTCLLFAVALLLAAAGASAQGMTALVNERTTLYSKPSEGYGSGILEKDEEIALLSLGKEWARVRCDVREGYVKRSALICKAEQFAAQSSVTMLDRTLYVFGEATLQSTTSSRTKRLHPGQEVLLLGVSEDNAQVLLGSQSGVMPLSALAVDAEMHYVLGLPGDSNEELETRLEEMGCFDAIPDAIFDLDTAEAVIRMRVLMGLSDEFSLDDKFLSALYSEDAPYNPIVIASLNPGDNGNPVKRLQRRLIEKGYLEDTPRGHYSNLTTQALLLYQQMEGLPETGEADPATMARLFSCGARRLPHNLIAVSDASSPYLPGSVLNIDWWEGGIQDIYALGTVAQVTDIATGITWQEMRRGGTNHADVQPVTAADTEAFKQAVGGTWSWQRRAIWVTIDGVRYAASTNCMPHGAGAIVSNNFPGHHCIHFLNSRTHGGNRLDEEHQVCVALAAQADYVTAGDIDWAGLYASQAAEEEAEDEEE